MDSDYGQLTTWRRIDICHLANYNQAIMDRSNESNLGEIIKQQRVMMSLTLQELAHKAGVSSSHLGRIERGERFPSAHVLRKLATPLGFEENELFALAGYLSPRAPSLGEESLPYGGGRLDPYVASVLASEPVDVQRAVIGILTILKSLARR
ncbi:hypothetical protein ES703_115742 [subsurface metagenome]